MDQYGECDVLDEIVDPNYTHRKTSDAVLFKPGLLRAARARLDSGAGPASQLIDVIAEGSRELDWSLNWPGNFCVAFQMRDGKVKATTAVTAEPRWYNPEGT